MGRGATAGWRIRGIQTIRYKISYKAILYNKGNKPVFYNNYKWGITFKNYESGFPGGTVVKNPPANAGDTGSSPGPGGSHMPWSN